MSKFRWLVTGTILGFVAAHLVNQTTEGRRFFDRLNRGLEEFNRAFDRGYHEVEPSNEDDVESALSSLKAKNDR
ncbi:hypothetical protein G7066_07735 [Leucobacter coleopterorum]|uniref:YtxH domain-containing protein n=1 Tax=Leucobacter coleopterorum TaxID=2714933 RepID=A0ABX6JY56_9MICO|nr:hypothetical protein [Leucobacter coleopterorum]QIM18533.1 hypothetical protein G7066_07735 [Leucobacter coleopterorum]